MREEKEKYCNKDVWVKTLEGLNHIEVGPILYRLISVTFNYKIIHLSCQHLCAKP